mmetsp:Transcript_51919/g.100331  ORF Transcript_51919/g.100331 Transcript_51919/m.100331 type:complete len:122 (-) Transcript_51919:142-507(-)
MLRGNHVIEIDKPSGLFCATTELLNLGAFFTRSTNSWDDGWTITGSVLAPRITGVKQIGVESPLDVFASLEHLDPQFRQKTASCTSLLPQAQLGNCDAFCLLGDSGDSGDSGATCSSSLCG